MFDFSPFDGVERRVCPCTRRFHDRAVMSAHALSIQAAEFAHEEHPTATLARNGRMCRRAPIDWPAPLVAIHRQPCRPDVDVPA
jgi:hypothetical protein